jgi:hypothetical protein
MIFMKAQYLTLEYLIFFMIGVFLIISVYISFSNINDIYRNSLMQNQLKMIGELISGTIINVYEASNSTNSSINYSLTMPTKLSGCIYAINATINGLNINCINVPNTGIVLTSYNFNISNKNTIYSTNGLLKLFATSGRVELS